MTKTGKVRSPQQGGVTPFQQRVYSALLRVPRGRVTTYRLLAKFIGCGSCQAVGQALRRNPFAPRVPCHRVIATDGSLGGFAGARAGANIERKRLLLAEEGVRFDANERLADRSMICDFSTARAGRRQDKRMG